MLSQSGKRKALRRVFVEEPLDHVLKCGAQELGVAVPPAQLLSHNLFEAWEWEPATCEGIKAHAQAPEVILRRARYSPVGYCLRRTEHVQRQRPVRVDRRALREATQDNSQALDGAILALRV